MRLSPTILAVVAFVLAGVFSTIAARVAVGAVEQTSVEAVREQLALEQSDWATVIGDGLQVIIEGEAPTEAARFRAMSIAGGIVDASRVIDNMQVADTTGIAAPDFAIEILRNDSGVSLIGLIPASTDREALSAEIARIADGAPVTDLLQSADYPVPAGWPPAIAYAIDALERLPRSKISVQAGRVSVTAISDSLTEQRQIEAELARSAPEGVTLAIDVSAPRPVISPFTVRFAIDDRGARFDACAADSAAERETILAAARAAGADGQITCTLALGVPTRRWGDGVAMAIAALDELGGGSVTFSDADVVLVAAEGVDAALFDRVVGELSNALPDVFSLDASLPVAPVAGSTERAEFSVTLTEEGAALVRGRVHDVLMNETVANFARAQFGAEAVTMGTRILPEGLPVGWSVRVLAGIEALSYLTDGSVQVLPNSIAVQGQTGDAGARDAISRLFIDKLGEGAQFRVDVAYVEALDPLAELPTPDECVTQIRDVTVGRKITFEPGSATLNADAMPIIDDIAEVLRLCGDLRLRISGFTDSQGREETNLRLSQQRAESVLDALRMRRVLVGSFEAVGYGEENPIADNQTEEGREANRRIEFGLVEAEGAAVSGDAPVGVDPDWKPENRPEARGEDRPELSVPPVTVEGAVVPEPTGTEEAEAPAEAEAEPAPSAITSAPQEPVTAPLVGAAQVVAETAEPRTQDDVQGPAASVANVMEEPPGTRPAVRPLAEGQ
jgi:OOP family OmpA-OmpF porin